MPTYEYRCLDCRRRFELFMKFSEYGTKPVTCPHCQSSHVERRIGRVRVGRSDENRLSNLADPANLAAIDDNPRALGKMMREMSHEVGEDMGGEFDEVVSRLESGQSPDDIERELPDLGSDSGGGPGGADL
ncbi:putative regulatory protein, FmdB family [Longilinea arvoryzae]|uniref:Putative regulatory protein, FmdB family n=1 Tax=Longilinea arvoryzae TaxID=360412 RepID=A0A0S7BIW6_9CHLR|nr:zinc ribbon domain-containing protein [Longilinea arvoryzae]GAP15561.1 putative regulatory protein, FmdB family [Longilinea arvoryzae]